MDNQKGASAMKVLAVLAVLAVVLFIGYTKFQRSKEIEKLMEQISSLGATVSQVHRHSSEIINNYAKNYALFLNKTENIPAGLTYKSDAIQAAYNAKIKATVDNYGVVIFEISNLDTESCIKIVTTDWGTRKSTQFVGVGIGKAPDFSCLIKDNCKFDYVSAFPGTYDYPFSIDRATVPCSIFEKAKEPAVVYLGYAL